MEQCTQLTEELTDLGAASVETRGGSHFEVFDNLMSSRKDMPAASK